jgi:small subunit ribosomal protein S1
MFSENDHNDTPLSSTKTATAENPAEEHAEIANPPAEVAGNGAERDASPEHTEKASHAQKSTETVPPEPARAEVAETLAHSIEAEVGAGTESSAGRETGGESGSAASEAVGAPPASVADATGSSSEPAPGTDATSGTEEKTSGAAAPAKEARPRREKPPRNAAKPKLPSSHMDSSADSVGEAAEAEGMEQLMARYSQAAPEGTGGETFMGRVVAVTDHGIVVDVGGKFEGLVPAQELLDLDTVLHFESGQTIEVERLNEHKDGYALLSHIRVHRRRVWESIEKSYREHQSINGKVVDRIKGGLVVDIGLRAFLPASQADLRPVHDLDPWKDKDVTVRVLKLNRKRGNVVVSRRVILEEEAKAKREAVLGTIEEGAVIRGTVKNITEYGVFVDLGGVDGLLHVSDLTWGRLTHPSEMVKVGDEFDVQVLKFDKEKGRISLGHKQLQPDPWANVPERYRAGTRTHGRVVGITDYGAFIQLEEGVEGLVHISEMTWSRRMKHPSKILKIGDELEVAILEVRMDLRRISLGIKQTMADPWEVAADRFPIGIVVHGTVRNVTDFGAFVEIEDGIEGLIHVGDLSWTERVKNPAEKFRKGQKVEAKVLKLDTEHRRLSLGVKQLNDPMAGWLESHRVGEVLHAKVARLTAFGAFVELAENVEGLCHISEIEERRPKGDRGDRENKPRDGEKAGPLVVGQEYDFKVIRIEPEQRKISLSYRAAAKHAEKSEMETFRSTKGSSTATIGDAIMAKRQTNT